jgi:transcriptional regulator with XRE-family HTH domain
MKKTGEIDIKLGQNLVRFRQSAGLSRKELADSIGITHQQMQKYEKGINRICVARLYDISRVLKVPLNSLIDLDSLDLITVVNENRSITDIMRYISRIQDESKLDAIKNLVRSLSISEVRNDNFVA